MGKNGTAWVSLDEQETVIQFGRCDNYSTIDTSDTTMKTKYDKLCRDYPQHWSCIRDDGIFSTYRCTPKTLISARAKTTERTYTDDQRKAMADRLRDARNKS